MHETFLAINFIGRCSCLPFSRSNNRKLMQQDGWNTQDGRMTQKCRVRLGMHSLAPHFFVILPSRVFQPSRHDGKLSTRYAVERWISYLATKNVVRVAGILQFSKSSFSLDSTFFPFTAGCCLMAILKSWTWIIVQKHEHESLYKKNLHLYNLRLLIFKRSLPFERQSLTNAIFLILIYSI